MSKAEWYEAADYAGIKTPKFSAYYGYEVTVGSDEADEDEEWCFEAKFGGRSRLIPWSELPGNPDRFNCAHCLLAGLTIVFREFDVTIAPNEMASLWAHQPKA